MSARCPNYSCGATQHVVVGTPARWQESASGHTRSHKKQVTVTRRRNDESSGLHAGISSA